MENFATETFPVGTAERIDADYPTTFLRRENATPELPRPTEPGCILVVDDDDGNREMLARRLTRLGHTVTTAENGVRALETIRTGHFDLMLLDIMMPELNGYQVLERLRAHPPPEALPVRQRIKLPPRHQRHLLTE